MHRLKGTAQDVVSQHIKQLPDLVRSLANSEFWCDDSYLCKILMHVAYSKDLQTAVIIIGGYAAAGAIIVPFTVAALGFSTGGVVAGKSPSFEL